MCGCVFVLAGGSAAQAEALDQGSVARDVDLGEVVQQVASAADHEEQAAPRVMVVFVLLEVLGKVHDALGQQGDLRLRGPGVPPAQPVFGQDLTLLCGGQRHENLLLSSCTVWAANIASNDSLD